MADTLNDQLSHANAVNQLVELRSEGDRSKLAKQYSAVLDVLAGLIFIYGVGPGRLTSNIGGSFPAMEHPAYVLAIFVGISLFARRAFEWCKYSPRAALKRATAPSDGEFARLFRGERDSSLPDPPGFDILSAKEVDLADESKFSTADIQRVLYQIQPRFWETIWLPTWANLVGICLLIHFSGGYLDSPLASVPAVVVVCGQLLSAVGFRRPQGHVPETNHKNKAVAHIAEVAEFTRRSLVHFRTSLAVLIASLGTLALVEELAIEVPKTNWAHPSQSAMRFVIVVASMIFATTTTYMASLDWEIDPAPETEQST